MRIFILAALASWARPAASFATTPGDPIYVENMIQAFVVLGLYNCDADDKAAYKSGLEKASTELVERIDEDGNGILTAPELCELGRMAAEPEVVHVAEAALANPPTNECVIGAVLPLVHDTGKTPEEQNEMAIPLIALVFRRNGAMQNILFTEVNKEENKINIRGTDLSKEEVQMYLQLLNPSNCA